MVTNWRGNTANRCPRPDSGHRGDLRQHLVPGAVETPPAYDDPEVQHQERPSQPANEGQQDTPPRMSRNCHQHHEGNHWNGNENPCPHTEKGTETTGSNRRS